MRDPDLIVRAQQAAAVLESAWCRWRKMHGLAAAPQPAVSSYVGYSLDAPWGQPRIVFGICAEEAEQLALLLTRHDCVGPVHAAVSAMDPEHSQDEAPAPEPAQAAQPEAPGYVHVPAPAPASGDQQPLSPSSISSRPEPRPAVRRHDPAAASALTSPSIPYRSGIGTPIGMAASRAVEASVVSRRSAAAASAAAPAGQDGAPAGPEDEQAAAPAGQQMAPVGQTPSTDEAAAAIGQEPAPAAQMQPVAAETDDREPASDPAQQERSRPVGGAAEASEPSSGAGDTSGETTQIFEGDWAAAGRRARQDDAGVAEPGDPGPPAASGLAPGSDPAEYGSGLGGSPGIVAFRPRPEPGLDEPDGRPRDVPVFAAPTEPASQPGGEPTRPARILRGASLPQSGQDRPATTSGTGQPSPLAGQPGQPGQPGRLGSSAASADAAAWTAGELPGQAAITDTAV